MDVADREANRNMNKLADRFELREPLQPVLP